MIAIKLFFFFSYLISISNEGSCSITTRAEKYTKCRDKAPTDSRNNVCCFLKANGGGLKKCVELRRTDIKGDRFKEVKNQIKAGSYDYWLMPNYTGFEEYKDNKTNLINKIDSLRCNNSPFLKYFGSFAILFTILFILI